MDGTYLSRNFATLGPMPRETIHSRLPTVKEHNFERKKEDVGKREDETRAIKNEKSSPNR